MIYLYCEGQPRILILETAEIEALKSGHSLASADKSVIIAWCPDLPWLAEQMDKSQGDIEQIVEALQASRTREENPTNKSNFESKLVDFSAPVETPEFKLKSVEIKEVKNLGEEDESEEEWEPVDPSKHVVLEDLVLEGGIMDGLKNQGPRNGVRVVIRIEGGGPTFIYGRTDRKDAEGRVIFKFQSQQEGV